MLATLGLILVGFAGAIAWLSQEFAYGGVPLERPTALFTALLFAAGIVYLAAAALAVRASAASWLLPGILLIGAAMRAVMVFSTPILEDDYYRYLWDGALTAHGHNPYAYVPAAVIRGTTPDEIAALGRESGTVLERVNHPELGTVYPTVAQGVFALAHFLGGWSLAAWRTVLLMFDAVTLGLILLLLKHLGKPAHFCLIYWWNPLVIVEGINSAHMDLLVLPFALTALWFAIRHAPVRGSLALSLAVFAKIWPLMIAPILLRAVKAPSKQWLSAALIAGLVCLVLVIPLGAARALGPDSGFAAYGERWQMNDALFMGFVKTAAWSGGVFGLEADSTGVGTLARAMAAAVLLTWIAYLAWPRVTGPTDLAERAVLALGVMFLLSPTGFPWYYLWLVPFLALNPSPALLLLTPFLALYYLKFHYDARGAVDFFHHRIVWIEFGPAILLFARELTAYVRRRHSGGT